MSLGLSHSLSRHKLKFSADKVDTMIIQAIALLDDLDKELNVYAMRVKEWYGWHFPEMAKIINDNMAYAKVIKTMGMRSNASQVDLSEILPEEIETALKAAAEVSMGTEITKEDLDNINSLAEQVVELAEYRQQLSQYLSARMNAIAPNLTILVGELVGARLIAHAGSLMNLSKSPASTVQILGAEKALFRALKTKHDTPKYGLIYHASLIGQATGKNKGKVARMLATKTSLGVRTDALSEDKSDLSSLGIKLRAKVEERVRYLEGKSALPRNAIPRQPGKWDITEAKKYNVDVDAVMVDAVTAPAVIAKAIMADVEMKGDESEDEAGIKPGKKGKKERGEKKEKKEKKDKKEKKEEKERKEQKEKKDKREKLGSLREKDEEAEGEDEDTDTEVIDTAALVSGEEKAEVKHKNGKDKEDKEGKKERKDKDKRDKKEKKTKEEKGKKRKSEPLVVGSERKSKRGKNKA